MKTKINSNKGLTLIEALIWFAIFAAVIAGVFALYNNSKNSNNASTISKELTTIFVKTEEVFASQSTGGLTTKLAVQLGIFPSSTKITDAANGTVYNVYGGKIVMQGYAPVGYTVNYFSIPKGSVCSSIVKSQRNTGWLRVYNGTQDLYYDETYTIAKVASFCGKDGDGTLELVWTRDLFA